jgi:hypothetical protein
VALKDQNCHQQAFSRIKLNMLEIEHIIEQLDKQLDSSGLYESDFDKSNEINRLILTEWQGRFDQAVLDDFKKHRQLDVSCFDAHFELFGNQGATVWTMRVIVNDETADPKLSFWLKSVINHKILKAFLEEICIRQPYYKGSNPQAKILFDKLKAKVQQGYESTIQIRELLMT